MTTESDILILGGGIIGLAIAIELKQRGARVTVLTRSIAEAATQAAAGMLAPQAEALPEGPLKDLGLKSLALYPNWTETLESLSKQSCGYWPCGIIAPARTRPNAPVSDLPQRQWLTADSLKQVQPHLGGDWAGAWWLPEEGQVDPRCLARALGEAAIALNINVQDGVTVTSLQQSHGRITAVQTDRGRWQADHYVLATGAWTNALLPVPVHPVKGQLFSVRQPQPGPALNQVLFGPGTYIVPRQDGRIVIGATVESVGFTPNTTPAGLRSLMHNAIQLYPPLGDYPVESQWWGFRPATPDEAPLLGPSHCENLTLATGHHRNGILLAPATALLIADHIVTPGSPSPLLEAFHWQRFAASHAASPHAALSYSSDPSSASPSQSLPPQSLSPQPLPPQPSLSSHSSSSMPSLTPNPFSPSASLASTPASPAEPPSATAQSSHVQSIGPESVELYPDTPLTIAGKSFRSRLMTGTGKYRTFEEMRQSIAASGCEIITVAVRRVQTNAPGHEGLADALDWQTLWMLPNTAGCKTAEEAVRVARLGREMAKLLGQEENNFIKLEVIPDPKYLLPDPIGTLQAAEQLVKEGFAVLPYINADPMLAKRLEEAGCATVMPLGSPIGSGQGIRNTANIQIIIENATIPVVVDAGIGAPSEAAQAMEMGADALLVNTAIAQASDPARMGRAMGMAAEAGRLAYLSGRIPVKAYASASSPLTGTIA